MAMVHVPRPAGAATFQQTKGLLKRAIPQRSICDTVVELGCCARRILWWRLPGALFLCRGCWKPIFNWDHLTGTTCTAQRFYYELEQPNRRILKVFCFALPVNIVESSPATSMMSCPVGAVPRWRPTICQGVPAFEQRGGWSFVQLRAYYIGFLAMQVPWTLVKNSVDKMQADAVLQSFLNTEAWATPLYLHLGIWNLEALWFGCLPRLVGMPLEFYRFGVPGFYSTWPIGFNQHTQMVQLWIYVVYVGFIMVHNIIM